MAILVTRSRMTSITTGTRNSAIQASAWRIAGASSLLPVHADRLAAQALDHLHVIDPIALRSSLAGGGVDVLETELDTVVHVEAALALTDQPQVAVVDQHMDVGQLELGPDGQLLDHELEVVVARQRDHLALRIGHADPQRRRHGPAQRSGLAAVDPTGGPKTCRNWAPAIWLRPIVLT